MSNIKHVVSVIIGNHKNAELPVLEGFTKNVAPNTPISAATIAEHFPFPVDAATIWGVLWEDYLSTGEWVTYPNKELIHQDPKKNIHYTIRPNIYKSGKTLLTINNAY